LDEGTRKGQGVKQLMKEQHDKTRVQKSGAMFKELRNKRGEYHKWTV
jgi:hypothetical protein